jgi:uncharacterized membrane-anchored protein
VCAGLNPLRDGGSTLGGGEGADTLPLITLAFRVVRICATTSGEIGGDPLSMKSNDAASPREGFVTTGGMFYISATTMACVSLQPRDASRVSA